jgi:hypothetical protein
MTRICWRLVDIVSRLLEPGERDAVRGDLAESGENAGRALGDVLGLVIRRQAALWKGWRPWAAVLGLVGITAAFLSEIAFGLDVTVGQQLQTYSHYGVHLDTGLTVGEDIVCMVCLSLALFSWSWLNGFALGSLSGRAIWLTGALFYLVALDFYPTRLLLSGNATLHNARLASIILQVLLPLSPSRILFSLAAIWGVSQGLRRRTLVFRQSLILAAAIVILTSLVTWTSGWYETAHETWSGGVWRGVPWKTRLLPSAMVSWPIGYMLAIASWRRWRGKTASG